MQALVAVVGLALVGGLGFVLRMARGRSSGRVARDMSSTAEASSKDAHDVAMEVERDAIEAARQEKVEAEKKLVAVVKIDDPDARSDALADLGNRRRG